MNAKLELSDMLSEPEIKSRGIYIKCAYIWKVYKEDDPIVLKLDYSRNDLISFFNLMDFDYDEGYGGQVVHGTVWLSDGTWLERGEYDGAEWWEHKLCPTIPEDCL